MCPLRGDEMDSSYIKMSWRIFCVRSPRLGIHIGRFIRRRSEVRTQMLRIPKKWMLDFKRKLGGIGQSFFFYHVLVTLERSVHSPERPSNEANREWLETFMSGFQADTGENITSLSKCAEELDVGPKKPPLPIITPPLLILSSHSTLFPPPRAPIPLHELGRGMWAADIFLSY